MLHFVEFISRVIESGHNQLLQTLESTLECWTLGVERNCARTVYIHRYYSGDGSVSVDNGGWRPSVARVGSPMVVGILGASLDCLER